MSIHHLLVTRKVTTFSYYYTFHILRLQSYVL